METNNFLKNAYLARLLLLIGVYKNIHWKASKVQYSGKSSHFIWHYCLKNLFHL